MADSTVALKKKPWGGFTVGDVVEAFVDAAEETCSDRESALVLATVAFCRFMGTGLPGGRFSQRLRRGRRMRFGA